MDDPKPIETTVSAEEFASSEVDVQKVELAKEFSKLLGEVMTEKKSRIELSQLIEHFDSFGDAVTVSAILGDQGTMAPSELAKLSSYENDPKLRKGMSRLSENLLNHGLANLTNFPATEKSFNAFLAESNKSNANLSVKEVLKQFYVDQGLVVHVPYEEIFNWDSYDGVLTTTYDPIVRIDWNEGFLYNVNGARLSSSGNTIDYVDDDYSYNNPTFVVTFYDEDNFMATPPEPTLPTPAANAVILGYNVNHTSISQSDILFTNVPEMRLLNNDYIGLFGSFTNVRLYRGSNKLKINFDGTVGSSAEGVTYNYTEVRFTKDDAKQQRWKSVNIQFDPDWDMSENSQQLIFFTKHNITGKAKAKASAKVGYDFIAKKPTAEFTTSVEVEVELGGSRFRNNAELSRRSVLATIVGDTGRGTRRRNGNDYNVKPIGDLEYYFEHYFTDIPE